MLLLRLLSLSLLAYCINATPARDLELLPAESLFEIFAHPDKLAAANILAVNSGLRSKLQSFLQQPQSGEYFTQILERDFTALISAIDLVEKLAPKSLPIYLSCNAKYERVKAFFASDAAKRRFNIIMSYVSPCSKHLFQL